ENTPRHGALESLDAAPSIARAIDGFCFHWGADASRPASAAKASSTRMIRTSRMAVERRRRVLPSRSTTGDSSRSAGPSVFEVALLRDNQDLAQVGLESLRLDGEFPACFRGRPCGFVSGSACS